MAELSAQLVIQRYESLKSDRGRWESHWQEVADLGMPRRVFTRSRAKGERIFDSIYDDTLPTAGSQFAGAVHGLLINPALRWFVLGVEDQSLERNRDNKLWLETATDILHGVFNDPASNFTGAGHETLLDLVFFGTAPRLRQFVKGMPRFQSKSLAECYLSWDDDGRLIRVFRCVKLPAHEVVMRWPDTASDQVQKLAADEKKYATPIEVIHMVEERNERDPSRVDASNKPWASVYVERESRTILGVGGFDDSPYVAPRWEKGSDEEYGRSIAMSVMPAVKMLNAMVKTNIQARERAVAPPLLVESDSYEGPIRTRPNSLIYIRGGSPQDPIRPLQTGARPDLGDIAIESTRDDVRRSFFMDLFRLPDNDRMTATEVIERTNQRLQLLSPIVARIQREWLDDDVTWTFNTMRRRGMIPPPPDGLRGRQFEIRYLSPLALSQRASESQGFLQLMNLTQTLVATDPTVLENLDADESFRRLAHLLNVSEQHMRSRSDTADIRQQRQQQQAALAQAQIAQTAADAANKGASALSEVGGGL